MVDVGQKPVTRRTAIARGVIIMQRQTLAVIKSGNVPKGEVLAVARVAAILAAKRCGELIPLCHGLNLDSVQVDFDFPKPRPKQNRQPLTITATASISAKTGVEMEALLAVSMAALTIYDMCKAIDKTMVIDGIELIQKTGGQHSNA